MTVILTDCLDDTVPGLAHFCPSAEGLREKRVYNERPLAARGEEERWGTIASYTRCMSNHGHNYRTVSTTHERYGLRVRLPACEYYANGLVHTERPCQCLYRVQGKGNTTRIRRGHSGLIYNGNPIKHVANRVEKSTLKLCGALHFRRRRILVRVVPALAHQRHTFVSPRLRWEGGKERLMTFDAPSFKRGWA
ncbi:hypothetical protein BC826DRAFT_420064 [Russula brevipes]|nr:hypothetical protein BC826DRAFT_420064 [Russula brevipes]